MANSLEPSEFSRPVDLRGIDARKRHLEADASERAALARRFGIRAIHRLEADIDLTKDGAAITATGRLSADIVQACAITDEDLPVTIAEELALRFIPETAVEASAEAELDLTVDELDDIPFSGLVFDLGEAVAQSLALAIDPFAAGPNADALRKEKGLLDEQAAGPFAALAALKGKSGD